MSNLIGRTWLKRTDICHNKNEQSFRLNRKEVIFKVLKSQTIGE
jgi:hypothetical protein